MDLRRKGMCPSSHEGESTLEERIHLTAAALKEQGVLSQKDLEGAGLLPVPGNANPYVPWDDPQIPYECFCGQTIYADTPHSHGNDPLDIELERVRNENKEAQMQLRNKLNIDEVVEGAIRLFNEIEVKHYLEDHGEEYRGAGRAFEAGDAVRAAMALLEGLNDRQSENDEVAPSWWPEAEERVRAAIPNYDSEIERRQQLGYQT
jgi:hypothetical protein